MHFLQEEKPGTDDTKYVLKILTMIEKEPPDYIRAPELKAQRNQCQGLDLG